MGIGEWLLAGLVAVAFAFVILRPDLWGRRGRSSDGGGDTVVGVGVNAHDDGDDDDDSESGEGSDRTGD